MFSRMMMRSTSGISSRYMWQIADGAEVRVQLEPLAQCHIDAGESSTTGVVTGPLSRRAFARWTQSGPWECIRRIFRKLPHPRRRFPIQISRRSLPECGPLLWSLPDRSRLRVSGLLYESLHSPFPSRVHRLPFVASHCWTSLRYGDRSALFSLHQILQLVHELLARP